MATTQLGELLIVIDEYQPQDGAPKPVFLRIGKLLQTTGTDGKSRIWGELDATQLNPTAASLAMNHARNEARRRNEKVDTISRIRCLVSPPRDKQGTRPESQATNDSPPPAEDDSPF